MVARMAQEVPQDTHGSVFDVVALGLGDLGALLARYHHAVHDGDMDAMADAQTQIEAQQGWDLVAACRRCWEKLELPERRGFFLAIRRHEAARVAGASPGAQPGCAVAG